MIDFVKQWVLNIVSLVLFIIMFEMLLPSGKMKKYIGLVTGTLMVIVIISPVISFMGENVDFTALQASNERVFDKLQIEKQSKMLEEEQMKQIVWVYRNKIIEQMEQNAGEIEGVEKAQADIIFNEDYTSTTFGEIKRVYLQIKVKRNEKKGDSPQLDSGENEGNYKQGDSSPPSLESESVDSQLDNSEKITPVTEVEPVIIGKIGGTKNHRDDDDESLDPDIANRLKMRIADVFGVDGESIIISKLR